VICFISTSPLTVYIHYSVTKQFTSCDGIDKIYTGEGFFEDQHNIYKIYDEKYSAGYNKSSIKEKLLIIKPPRDLLNGNNYLYDCEDFAFLLNECLAPKYNVSTEYYVIVYLNKPGGHIGTRAYDGTQWVQTS